MNDDHLDQVDESWYLIKHWIKHHQVFIWDEIYQFFIWDQTLAYLEHKNLETSRNCENVIFDNVWMLSKNHTECVWKLRQLSTMYCAIWLVDFWPIMILAKYISFYVFQSRTAQIRALNPLLVLFSFRTSQK